MSEHTAASVPSSFRYANVLKKGKPVHNGTDRFTAEHPPMDLTRRAKIFSPFDALKGFGDELAKAQSEVADAFLTDTEDAEEPP